jgi:hypothetical protein
MKTFSNWLDLEYFGTLPGACVICLRLPCDSPLRSTHSTGHDPRSREFACQRPGGPFIGHQGRGIG